MKFMNISKGSTLNMAAYHTQSLYIMKGKRLSLREATISRVAICCVTSNWKTFNM